MIRIAVVGSRTFQDYDTLKKILDGLEKPFIIVSGGAVGADQLAERYAKENGLLTEIYRPDWERYGRAAGMIRNKILIDKADQVVAFWDGKSTGTQNTIERATKAGKLLFVTSIGVKA